MTTQPNWDRRVGSATEELIAVIEKENALDRGILSNSQNKPKYSLLVTYLIGAVILVLMLTGVAVGMWGNHGY